MDELMQVIYGHVIDDQLGKYYAQTAYEERIAARDAIGSKLWTQLKGEQRSLLEQLQRAYDYAQMAELEAMFLASFDAVNSLHRQHTA